MGDKKRLYENAQGLRASISAGPYGMICNAKEFFCLRCGHLELIEVPDSAVKQATPEIAGDMLVDYLARQQGWATSFVRINDQDKIYMLCPQCVADDFSIDHGLPS